MERLCNFAQLMKTHRTQNLLFTMKKISAIIAAGALLAIGFNTSAYAQFKCQIPLPRDLVQLSNDNIILSHEQTDAEVYRLPRLLGANRGRFVRLHPAVAGKIVNTI